MGDKWKDGNIIGIYKLNQNINPPESGGRPTYQKADKSNMYLNYYAPDHEWGFRNKLALGQRRSYTFLKPVMVCLEQYLKMHVDCWLIEELSNLVSNFFG